jgi:hypothetical protein
MIRNASSPHPLSFNSPFFQMAATGLVKVWPIPGTPFAYQHFAERCCVALWWRRLPGQELCPLHAAMIPPLQVCGAVYLKTAPHPRPIF